MAWKPAISPFSMTTFCSFTQAPWMLRRLSPDFVMASRMASSKLDGEIALSPEIATQVLIDMSDPRSEHFGQMRHETLPADHLFGRRMEMLTLAVLGQLRAQANWHRVAREWLYEEPAETELGREEERFYARAAA